MGIEICKKIARPTLSNVVISTEVVKKLCTTKNLRFDFFDLKV
jgi:hypothetical protein